MAEKLLTRDGKICCRVLTGPTGSGKSEAAMRIAEETGCEILCMDSMQIYRGMNIGTAKPTPAEQARIPHHLLDICDPTDAFSVADYREQAEETVMRLARAGRPVLFVGGTGLYLQAMMHPMELGAVQADENLRAELRSLADAPGGKKRLHEMLRELDPVTADRLPLNDVRRTIRAIEVSRATGIPFSAQPKRETPSVFSWRVVSTQLPREELYRRINARVDRMIRAGLAEEVQALLDAGVPEDAQSMAGLGYKEMIPFLKGQCSLEDAADAIRLGSRHYAKRQMTFLRREAAVQYVDVTAPDACDRIKSALFDENPHAE